MISSELRRRRGRTLALLVGVLVATTAFTVLTGAAKTGRLVVRGTVYSPRFRAPYDILVRPRGARTALERSQDLVRPDVLSGIFGGITLAQWQAVLQTPGVSVAAPIAVVGYALPDDYVPIDLTRYLGRRERALFRVRVERVTDRGLTRQVDASLYVYITRRPVTEVNSNLEDPTVPVSQWAAREHLENGTSRPVCGIVPNNPSGPFDPTMRGGYPALGDLDCWSVVNGNAWQGGFAPFPRGHAGALVPAYLPVVIAAIDPAQEARLDGLNRALVSGRYLRTSDHPTNPHEQLLPIISVLAPTQSYSDEEIEATVQRLPEGAAQRMVSGHPLYQRALEGFLARQPGKTLRRLRAGSSTAMRSFLAEMAGHGYYFPSVPSYWTVGPTSYRAAPGGGLVPRRVHNNQIFEWVSNGAGEAFFQAPLSAKDPQFRHVVSHSSPGLPGGEFPELRTVGTFDAAKLAGFAHPLASPLQTFLFPGLYGANPRSRRLLHGRSLLPNGNLGGYPVQPPLLLTNLRSLSVFGEPNFETGTTGAPISAIRVRVAGVHGVDPLSLARVRLAAQRIERRTHLDVDLTVGSSPAPRTIDLPAGHDGRPALELTEPWTKKGVAIQILSAIDKKSLILFVLILVVCALSVANATSAAVRARQTELGVLACLGWTPMRLFGVVLGEVAAIGLVAGVLGGAIALPIATAAGVQASPLRAALAIPAALALALVAGAIPAWRAARTDPAQAVKPPVLEARRGHSPRTVGQLALVNALRTPGRSTVGALSVAVGVCALTLLLGAVIAFHQVLVGSLLGNVVSVQVSASDYVAVVAIIVLGSAALADVVYLNLRERAAELATLRATGWDERALARLIALEGLTIGATGSLAGAIIGLAATALFAGTLPGTLVATSAAAAVIGTLSAATAALLPATFFRRQSLVAVLAGE